ncbi:MAG: YitT family protein, partial [Oscillospiraceae bacterium]|nr:YitT family protein [Oscillospiraceae bacterium]
MKVKEKIIDYLIITLATVVAASSVFFFLVPSNVSVGSVSGLAIILSNFIPLSVATLTMLMNIILLIIGFIFIGKDFGIKTVYTSLLVPAVMWVLEQVFPNFQSLTGDQILDVISFCALSGISLSVLFIHNASSGGLDIIAKILNRYFRMDFGRAVGVVGMAVALSSAFVYDAKTVILSVLGTYFSGMVLDHFIFGSTLKKKVCVISEKNEEILDFVLHKMHSGATTYDATGAYTNNVHKEIVVVVYKNEYLDLINFITKTDPNAFITVYSINEVIFR